MIIAASSTFHHCQSAPLCIMHESTQQTQMRSNYHVTDTCSREKQEIAIWYHIITPVALSSTHPLSPSLISPPRPSSILVRPGLAINPRIKLIQQLRLVRSRGMRRRHTAYSRARVARHPGMCSGAALILRSRRRRGPTAHDAAAAVTVRSPGSSSKVPVPVPIRIHPRIRRVGDP
jgi:hypothetical protein